MAYIYKITNKVNQKLYVGKTILSIQERFAQHKRDSNKQNEEIRPLYRAMQKYGVDNFNIELIEECDSSIMNERERYWIEYYQSFRYGYNATIGGDGKQYYDYSQIYALWNEGLTSTKIKEIIGCSYDTIRLVLDQYHVSKEDRIKRVNMDKALNIAMLDMKTGEIIQVFASLGDAAKFLGKTGKSHISDACKGKRQTAYGYKWKFI